MSQKSSIRQTGLNNPKQWSVKELQQSLKFKFKEEVFNESSFSVFFSNQGTDRKLDPLYNKRRERGSQHRRPCSVIINERKRCNQETSSPFGVCKKHKKEILEKHTGDWVGHFIPPSDTMSNLDTYTRKRIQNSKRLLIPMHGWLIERLLSWSKSDKEKENSVNRFMQEITELIPGKIPDATSLQLTILTNQPKWVTPKELVDLTKKTVDRFFPFDRFSNANVPNCIFASRPKRTDMKDKNLAALSIEIPNFPVRAIATLIFLAMVSEEANRGDAWFRNKYNLGEAERAGAHFAYTVYVLRRENRMSIKQITKLLQIPPWE